MIIPAAYSLAQDFAEIVRERKAAALPGWLQAAKDSGVAELRSFAPGLQREPGPAMRTEVVHILHSLAVTSALPALDKAEVLCLGIAAQWRQGVPWRSERGCLRYLRKHWRTLFPQLISQSVFNRRLRRCGAPSS